MQIYIKILMKLVLMLFLRLAPPFGLTREKQGDILKTWEKLS